MKETHQKEKKGDKNTLEINIKNKQNKHTGLLRTAPKHLTNKYFSEGGDLEEEFSQFEH